MWLVSLYQGRVRLLKAEGVWCRVTLQWHHQVGMDHRDGDSVSKEMFTVTLKGGEKKMTDGL